MKVPETSKLSDLPIISNGIEYHSEFIRMDFKEVVPETKQQFVSDLTDQLRVAGYSDAKTQALNTWHHYKRSEFWSNSNLQAILDKGTDIRPDFKVDGEVIQPWHLSFKYHDRRTALDWGEIQWMKNEIAGEDIEFVMIFPNEKRLVDQANQFHLWSAGPGWICPFGWMSRQVKSEVKLGNAKQRRFSKSVNQK